MVVGVSSGASPKPKPTPVTVLVHVYRLLKVMSHKERLEMATWLTDKPQVFDGWFKRSVERFERDYENVAEPFHPPRDPARIARYKKAAIGTTPELVARLAERPAPDGFWQVVGDPGLDFAFVDYEVPPARKTGRARFEDGLPSTSGMKMDLLLKSRDRIPVVGEAKVSTDTGDDKDPFFALVQALALAAQVVTPKQLARLALHYPKERFRQEGVVDVVVVLFKPSLTANSTFQDALYRQSVKLVDVLIQQCQLKKRVRRLAFIEAARSTEGQLVLKKSPLHH